MKNALLLLCSILLFQSCAETPTPDPTTERIKQVETGLSNPVYIEGDSTWTITERMAHYGVPGVSIAVIHEGKIEWAKAYGVLNRESKDSVTEQTLFQAASISKPVTAYGALSLVEQEKVALETDINDFLTSWQLPESEFTTEKKVTVKNLLSHTAGVTVHGFLGYRPDLPVPTLLEVLNGTPPANSNPTLVDKVPEESFRYSGGGYNVLQQMMIDVEGKAFPSLMHDLVLAPLQMNNSTFEQPLSGAQLALAATGYLPDGTMVNGKRHTYPEMAPAGLWTTPTDLAKFAIHLQESLQGQNNKGLSKEMTEKMLTPFVEEFIGLGIFLYQKKDETYFGHGGWNEGFSSELMAHKDKGYGVVVMTNSNHPPFISEVVRSVALAYGWEDYVPVYQKMPVDSLTVTSVSGRYALDGNRILEVYPEGTELYLKELGLAAKELVKISDSSFVQRNGETLFQFKSTPENGDMQLVVVDANTKKVISSHPKMDDETKVPSELLIEGDFDQALAAYQALQRTNANDPTVDENELNRLGYYYLRQDKPKIASAIFKVNTLLYPASFNVYDSYAEACMKLGDVDLAIFNYTKSLELNPENTNAKEQLRELEKSGSKSSL